ncbi:MAG: rhodanese-like domain-containing protein [Clostridia bacterium]|nr:rhodanese-like domain-containing protein [Clostridia bacterium]
MIYVIGLIVLWIVYKKITAPPVEHISVAEVKDMIANKSVKQCVDVRTAGEFNSHKIKGFKNVPLQSLQNKLDQFKKDEPIVVICASGSRSMAAAKVLHKAGFERILNVKGGIR